MLVGFVSVGFLAGCTQQIQLETNDFILNYIGITTGLYRPFKGSIESSSIPKLIIKWRSYMASLNIIGGPLAVPNLYTVEIGI